LNIRGKTIITIKAKTAMGHKGPSGKICTKMTAKVRIRNGGA
jgi:hypothetical protein